MPGALKTRAKRAAVRKNGAQEGNGDHTEPSTAAQELASSTENPPKVYVLPKDLSTSARVLSVNVSLRGTNTEARRFLVCPNRGFFEFTKVSAPKRACRSWLLAPGACGHDSSNALDEAMNRGKTAGEKAEADNAYVLQSPDLFVATPLDPLFLLLASRDVLWPNSVMGNAEYLSIDTRLGTLRSQNGHLDQIMRDDPHENLERLLSERMKAVCEIQIIPGEEMDPAYCLSLPKLYTELVKLATRVVQKGMPASMEEQFVTQTLRVPELIVAREDSGVSIGKAREETDSMSAAQSPHSDGKETEATESAVLNDSTPLIPPVQPGESVRRVHQVSDDIRKLLRIRTVIEYATSSYLPTDLRTKLQAMMDGTDHIAKHGSKQVIDFGPLSEHLGGVAALKKEAQALRSLSDNISRKRNTIEDEDALEKTEAKRRKKEEEEIKKKNISRGVQQLAKADTSGMKKLSAFFSQAPAKKK